MPKLLVRSLLVLILALITLTLATCISAEQTDYIRYDAARDEFQMLMVLQDIHTQDSDDAAYLEAIYKNRDHLIAPALPGGASAFPLAAFSLLRMTDVQFATLNMFVTRPTTLEATESIVPLNSIKITPGTFFIQNKKLGYYQAITVPGKTLDAALEELSKTAQDQDMVKSIDKEINRRAEGGKVFTWAEAKADALNQIKLEETPDSAPPGAAAATEPEKIGPEKVLDLQSLNNLKLAATGKTMRLRRDKHFLLLTLPLTARDSAEITDLYKQAQKRLDEVILAAKGKTDLAEKLQTATTLEAVVRSLALAPDKTANGAGAPGGLNISLDLLSGVRAIAALPSHRVDLNQKNDTPPAAGQPAASAPAPVDAIAFLHDQKVVLNETLTADQIIKDFNAGTLKAYPSENPVKPGEGIAKPQEQAPQSPPPAMP